MPTTWVTPVVGSVRTAVTLSHSWPGVHGTVTVAVACSSSVDTQRGLGGWSTATAVVTHSLIVPAGGCGVSESCAVAKDMASVTVSRCRSGSHRIYAQHEGAPRKDRMTSEAALAYVLAVVLFCVGWTHASTLDWTKLRPASTPRQAMSWRSS